MRIAGIVLCLALLGGLPATAAAVRTAPDVPDSALRESVHRLEVAGTGAEIVVTVYRPPGQGPFPWIVLSHGTAVDRDANRKIGRYRSVTVAREWLSRGYGVVIPVRRGYGASGGDRLGDDHGGCKNPDFERGGDAAAKDLLTAIDWARKLPELDPNRWMLVGQSSGGFASIYAASRQPPGLRAVLAFAPGRGGRPDTHPGQPCQTERLASVFAKIAPSIRVPVLWFYAENDEYIGPTTQRLWFSRFSEAGGRGDLVVVPPFPERRGHGVMPSPAGTVLWTSAVDRFLKARQVQMPFARP